MENQIFRFNPSGLLEIYNPHTYSLYVIDVQALAFITTIGLIYLAQTRGLISTKTAWYSAAAVTALHKRQAIVRLCISLANPHVAIFTSAVGLICLAYNRGLSGERASAAFVALVLLYAGPSILAATATTALFALEWKGLLVFPATIGIVALPKVVTEIFSEPTQKLIWDLIVLAGASVPILTAAHCTGLCLLPLAGIAYGVGVAVLTTALISCVGLGYLLDQEKSKEPGHTG